ncbi:holo-ACP synthase [Ruminococcus sp. Marseille-P6503]|uniref:holo-ACP synthase n=1 Tax=Ruminococcus sp. Marseille-P6503 TaxID=2364796 RepID=UPI000F547540|nr:holo-ACP synthase [Ruminococcus sp. Marseille-P6503]
MYTVGIDLIEIARIEKSVKSRRFVERVFSEKEIALFSSKSNSAESMAGNWAAKEAFSKALGTGVRDFSLNEVSVLRDGLGAPYLELTGNAEKIADKLGLEFSVSITHTSQLAQAVCIGYRKSDQQKG